MTNNIHIILPTPYRPNDLGEGRQNSERKQYYLRVQKLDVYYLSFPLHQCLLL